MKRPHLSKRGYKTLSISIIGVLVILTLTIAILAVNNQANPLPEDIRTKLTFSPALIDKTNKTYTTDNYATSRAEDGTLILSYTITLTDGATVTLSEYTQPNEFTEITDYRQQFLNNVIQQTETIQSANGVIYLGQLAKQDNQQIGVMLDNGLIVFMRPSRDLGVNDWRQLAEALEVFKQ